MPQGDTGAAGPITANSGSQTSPAAGSFLRLNAQGVSSGSLQISGTFTGTLLLEGTLDGSRWATVPITTLAGVSPANVTAPGFWTFNAEPFNVLQVRATAWTSGQADVWVKVGPGGGASGASGGGGGGGGAVTIADGADAALGTTTDAGIITDTSGTAIGFLRGQIIQWAAALTRWGSVTETAPATDTASSGLNGRLQRVAQRLSSLIALLPAALVGGRLDVNVGATGVTQPVSGTVTANAGTGTFQEQGDVAHGSADSGNPVKHGAVAIAHGTNPTAVTAAQRTNLYANRAGVPFMIGGHPNIQTVRANFTAAQTDTALITIATGLKIVVTGFIVTAHNANTVNTSVVLGFGTVNTPTTTGVIGAHPGIAPGSGFARGSGSGIIGVGADDADLRITISVPTGGSLDVCVTFHTVES